MEPRGIEPVKRIRNYFLRGLAISVVFLIYTVIYYYLAFMLPTWLPGYGWIAWLLVVLWIPISFIVLGWIATEVVLRWIPAVKVEVKPAITLTEKYLDKVVEKTYRPRTVNARVLIKYTSGEWKVKNYWGYPENLFYDLIKEMRQSPFTEYVIVVYYDEKGRFIRAIGEKGTSEIFESSDEVKRFVKTH